MARYIVVDDEPSLRFLNRLNLEERGHEVEEADSGDALLARFEAGERWEGMILDQRMPGTTGIEAARRLRERGDRTPIILFSGYLEPEVERLAGELSLVVVDKTDLDRLMELVDTFAPTG